MGNRLTKYISSKKSLIYINDYDYREIDNYLLNGLKEFKNVEIYEYRAFGEIDFKTKIINNNPINLMGFLKSYMTFGSDRNVMLLLKDVDHELKNPEVIAILKKIAETSINYPEYSCTVAIISQNASIPKELENYIAILEIPKLTKEEIEKYIQDVAKERNLKVDKNDLGEIAISLKGLSKWCITQILNGMETISSSAINGIIKEKGQIIKKSGILELINFKERAQDIGGLENLKEWLGDTAKIFRKLDEAKRFGVDIPKGMLLVGMPGCGKSLTAKAASRMFNVPLLRLDIGRLLGKYVGESEHNLRMALKIAESISPCILWIDEIEKAFAGIDQTGGASDITKRLFGQFLTWLQEKENTVFVVATANDITPFPPEFLRKGRFDEIFYVDFPNRDERKEIFRIHLEKRGKYNEEIINLDELAAQSESFCGADIEEAVKTAVKYSFLNPNSDDNRLYTEDILKTIKELDPLKIILKEKIDALKKAYEKFNLKPASLKEAEKTAVSTNRKTYKKGKIVQITNKNMILVTGGKYTPSFFDEEREVKDLWVSKYQTTRDDWKEIIGASPISVKSSAISSTKELVSHFFSLKISETSKNLNEISKNLNENPRHPMTCISYIHAFEYCNKLSQIKGLQPAYKIENDKLKKVIYANGEEIDPDVADFSKVEGFRLPTHLEWEWFARGGEIAIQEGTFDYKYSGSNNPEDVGWFKNNSGIETHAVGSKKPNQLGLYDCSGNVWEWAYDTTRLKLYYLHESGTKIEKKIYLNKKHPYIYNKFDSSRIILGGCYNSSPKPIDSSGIFNSLFLYIGFRVVRTAM